MKVDQFNDLVFANVVVPQTVWEETKARNPASYKKMNDIVYHQGKGFYVFMNEFCLDTHCARLLTETKEQRCDRAVIIIIEILVATYYVL